MATRRAYRPRSKKPSLLDAYKEAPVVETYDWPAAPLPGGPEGHVVVEIPFPDGVKPHSYNASANTHWTTERVEKMAWQHAACRAFQEAADFLAPYRGHRILLTIAIPVPDRRRRDAHNYTPTILKPICDGITRAGTLWPDDNTVWLATREPALYVSDARVLRVKVECAPLPEDPTGW